MGENIVTIDGPAGAGKSTAARQLAVNLGFRFLDTGAMYRAVAFAALKQGIDLTDAVALGRLASDMQMEMVGDRLLLDGVDVTDDLRTSAITSATHYAADHPDVRGRLVELQRCAAGHGDVVSEGRDQGTVVFPDAGCKFFLTASAEERARRRVQDLESRGEQAEFEDVLAGQNQRDERDAARDVGPLVAAEDAVHIPTDGMTVGEVVNHLEELVRKEMQVN